MISVAEMLQDPDLCSPFTILRSTGSWVAGVWTPNGTRQAIQSYGAVRNSTGKELALLPEGDRPKEALTFETVDQLFAANLVNSQISDYLQYPANTGDEYKILKVKNYSEQGYWMALATRVKAS